MNRSRFHPIKSAAAASFFFLIIYFKGRVTLRLHPLPNSSNLCLDQGWAVLKPGAGASSQSRPSAGSETTAGTGTGAQMRCQHCRLHRTYILAFNLLAGERQKLLLLFDS